MKRISSGKTFFFKKVFPVFWFGFLAVFIGVGVFAPAKDSRPPMPFFIIPIVMAAFGFFLMKFLVFDLVDEVFDCGDHLIVRNNDREERVNLNDIMNISLSQFTNPERATLLLRTPGSLGPKVTFIPLRKMFRWSLSNPIIDDLIKRVDDSKR